MRNNDYKEWLRELGYKPVEDERIVVSYGKKNLSDQVAKFFFPEHYILQVCESELVIIPISKWDAVVDDKPHLILPLTDIESVTVEDNLFNYDIDIMTEQGLMNFTTQQKELSGLRFSGMLASSNESIFGNENWHAENMDRTLEKLKSFGS